MNCTVEMDSDGMIYVPNFMSIDSGIQVILTFNVRTSKYREPAATGI
jgi:hypothetical protein